MKTRSPYALALACLLSLSITIPTDIFATPPDGVQRAGEVSKVIPAVSIARGAKTLPADAKTVVDWDDFVNTQASARARVGLDDGSVLNVGSDSSVHVIKHDAGAQQTDLEVGFGKVRSQAQKLSKPGGKFEVHTPAGVAGVVGTDFYVAYENSIMTVIVYEGKVRVCNLAGVCVEVVGGQMTTVRNGDNSAPAAPTAAAASVMTGAAMATSLEGEPNQVVAHHIGKGTWITLGIIAAIPAIVVPIVTTRGSSKPPAGATNPCPPGNTNCG